MNSVAVKWEVVPFQALEVRRFHDILRLRVDVFVVEQDCPYPELDGHDPTALHVMGSSPDGRVIAYARILRPRESGLPAIGRVVVEMEQRGRGLGRELMERCLRALEEHFGSRRSILSAQAHLRSFYEGLGYVAVRDIYPLDDIPHIDMRLSE